MKVKMMKYRKKNENEIINEIKVNVVLIIILLIDLLI